MKRGIFFILSCLLFSFMFGIVDVNAEEITGDITVDKVVSEDSTWDGGYLQADLTINSGVTLTVNGTIMVSVEVVIAGGGIIKRGSTFGDYVIDIFMFGSVTMSNITMDGDTEATEVSSLIRNNGDLTIDNCAFQNNDAGESGGAIRNQGLLTINNSIIQNNSAGEDGGGILNYSEQPIVLNDVIIRNNTAINYGGGIYDAGDYLEINNSTIQHNSSHLGAGVLSYYGTIGLKGNVIISDNETTEDDISNLVIGKVVTNGYTDLEASNLIIIDEMGNESNVGLSTLLVNTVDAETTYSSYPRVIAEGYDSIKASNYLNYFHSDIFEYVLIANSDDNIELVDAIIVVIDGIPYAIVGNQTLSDISNLSTIKTRTGYLFDKFIDGSGNQFVETTPITSNLVLTTVFISNPQTGDINIVQITITSIIALLGIIFGIRNKHQKLRL